VPATPVPQLGMAPPGPGPDEPASRPVRATSPTGEDHPTLVEGYRTWQEAVSDSTGFASPEILAVVLAARERVLRGEVAFEADGATFPEIVYSWPVLAGLLSAALAGGGQLRVIDFGGSLGNHLLQNAAFLAACPELRWGIVEQPAYVAAGRRLDLDPRLTFHTSIEDCLTAVRPTVALASGSIQLVEDPFGTLAALCPDSVTTLLLDRTPLAPGESWHRICVERVPDGAYRGSFPTWVFAREPFYRSLPAGFTLVSHFPALDGCWETTAGTQVVHEGAILRRQR